MFIPKKSKYYKEEQEYLKQKKKQENKIINHIKIKNNEWSTKNRC